MILPPPGSTRTAPLFPYATLFRSCRRRLRPAPRPQDREPDLGQQRLGACRRFPVCPLVRTDGRGRVAEGAQDPVPRLGGDRGRSEEHTSELQSLMRISYAVFCLKKKNKKKNIKHRQYGTAKQ